MGLLVFGAMRSRGQNMGMMPKQFQQMGGRDEAIILKMWIERTWLILTFWCTYLQHSFEKLMNMWVRSPIWNATGVPIPFRLKLKTPWWFVLSCAHWFVQPQTTVQFTNEVLDMFSLLEICFDVQKDFGDVMHLLQHNVKFSYYNHNWKIVNHTLLHMKALLIPSPLVMEI